MVNSPSWPNLRLLAPPALVDCGGMTPLWHRETCLPVHRPPVPNQTKSDHAHPLPARCSRGGFPDLRNPESVPKSPQSRQKPLQSCIIKAYQGKRQKSPLPLEHPRSIPFATLRLRTFALKPRHQGTIKPQSRQKTQQSRLIVHNQGKPKISPRHPAPRPEIPHLRPSALICGQRPLPSPSPESVSHFPPIKAKTPVIVHHQGISRHRPKNTRPLGASLEHSDWNWELPHPTPFAPLQLRAYAFPPASSLNQGKKPSHRA